MGLKVCNEPGCPELSDRPKCPKHRRETETRRGTRQSRGYDLAYDHERRRAERDVAAGRITCWACLTRISPLEAFHLGHCENDRAVIHGPEHPKCNLGHVGKSCPHQSHK